jgi:hypothetical protein
MKQDAIRHDVRLRQDHLQKISWGPKTISRLPPKMDYLLRDEIERKKEIRDVTADDEGTGDLEMARERERQ